MCLHTEREPGPLTGGKPAMQRSRPAAIESHTCRMGDSLWMSSDGPCWPCTGS